MIVILVISLIIIITETSALSNVLKNNANTGTKDTNIENIEKSILDNKNNIGNNLCHSLLFEAQEGHNRQNEINSFSQTFLAITQQSANKRKLQSDNHYSSPRARRERRPQVAHKKGLRSWARLRRWCLLRPVGMCGQNAARAKRYLPALPLSVYSVYCVGSW